MELVKLARFTIDEFSEIPASAKDEVVHDLVDGLESIFQDYISFVAVRRAGDAVAVLHKLFDKIHCQELLQKDTSAATSV